MVTVIVAVVTSVTPDATAPLDTAVTEPLEVFTELPA